MNLPAKATQTDWPFDVTRISPHIGAVLSGVDMAQPLSAQMRDAIYQALLAHRVLFMRDQDISTEQHLAFAGSFGDLEVHPFSKPKPGYPEILRIVHDETNKGKENDWHSDVTWRQEPSLGSILRLVEVPEIGGDTLWANMVQAYADLPEHVKERLEGAVAEHDFTHFRKRLRDQGSSEEEIEALNQKYPKPHHPVIRTIPETGEKAIYVNLPFTRRILDWPEEESQRMLKYLFKRASIPEYQCRFRWQRNSVAFWDNRTSQHYAVSDYFPHRRVAERATVVGSKPV